MSLQVSGDFGPFDGRVWLNCSHQGPLPKVAVAAAHQAVEMKTAPHPMTRAALFREVPHRLRTALGRLIGVDADDVILGNSTSYGLNVLANGIRWRDGDEVLLVAGDFPATIFPWLPLRDRGVTVRFIEPEGPYLDPAELEAQITPATRLFCTTWVHSFTGYAVDEAAITDVCKRRGVLSVLNVSQGLGHRPLNPDEVGLDAISGCGFKWLCGPYGTGFSWIRPEVRETMAPVQGYWLANLTADDLRGDFDYEIRSDLGARAYDLTCTANFLNFMPWTRSVEYLLECGLEHIRDHDLALASRLIAEIEQDRFEILSPTEGRAQTPIVVLRHHDESQNERCFEALRAADIDISLRRGALRVSPHLYNTEADINRLLELINSHGV